MKQERHPRGNAAAKSGSQTGAPAGGAPKKSWRSTPPYNPELQKLVEGKRAWDEPLSEEAKAKGFLGWHQRGYLPHYDAPWVTQIVTIRLWDSLPASRRGEWEHFLKIEDLRERRKQLESYLDRGFGECWLRRPAIANVAEAALRFFDGQQYWLEAWVVMPNHIHLLVEVWEIPLAKLLKTWKGLIAREANKLLARSGTFWEREYWDTLVEDEEHRRRAVKYVENNPIKAGLTRNPKEWQWNSARWRDNYGNLKQAVKNRRMACGESGS